MESKFCYRVQQWERKEWKTKVETLDLNFAYEQAHARFLATKERVRVVRVESSEIVKFF